MLFAASLACAAVVFSLLLRAFWQRSALPVLPGSGKPGDTPPIAIVIPARNEERNIERCLEGLLEQDYPALTICVIDDSSSDSTAAIASRIAARDNRVRVVRSPPLERGWTGKCQACWVAAQTVPRDAAWLCFIDADMRCEPGLLSSAVRAAAEAGAGLISLAPRHELVSFAERLMIPSGLIFLAFCQDLTHLQAPDSDGVTANGQFMLVDRKAYGDAGGHAAVRGSVCEDVALATALKRQGHRVLLLDGTAFISTRMYDGWNSLWEGFSKNLSHMLGGPARTVLCAIAALLLAWGLPLVPALDLFQAHAGWISDVSLIVAVASLLAWVGLHVACAWHFRIPLWYGLLFPLGYSIGAVMALDSLRRRMTGRVVWKGRVYP